MPARTALPAALAVGVAALGAATATANGGTPARVDRHDVVADLPGRATSVDRHLVNPWGLAALPGGPLWVADNGADVATLYTAGRDGRNPQTLPLVVSIPGGAPTGQVANTSTRFRVRGAPALFLLSSESGRITAWNMRTGNRAVVVARRHEAIYKGLAIAGDRLYATDFHNGRIDVWDGRFRPVAHRGRFVDRRLPRGYAPFGIEALRGGIFVTYARQDADREDDASGPRRGFVDVYDRSGRLLRRLVSQGRLNSPWGLALAPRSFGRLAGDLLVGNFGDGRIDAYRAGTGRFQAVLADRGGQPLRIDGLWALKTGITDFGGARDVVFSAGPEDEQHGIVGVLAPAR